jgi:hypothetical protein
MDYITLAEKALRGSEQSKWTACLVSACMVGEYYHGYARSLAEKMGYEVSRISDFADAGRARKALKMPFRDVSMFSIGCFTHSWKVIKSGVAPEDLREFLYEIITELGNRPNDHQVKELMNGRFDIPVREPTAKTWLKMLDRLVSWGASKVDHVHRSEWDNATKTIREILKGYQ